MIGALSVVDLVTAFEADSPVELLELVRPDVYAKGGDYTPEMLPETPVVEALGGEVRILDYLADHSTSAIVARAQASPRPGRRPGEGTARRAAGVLVIGDALLDVDVDGRVERTTPDAGLPVLDVTDEVARPGGAGLAAALLGRRRRAGHARDGAVRGRRRCAPAQAAPGAVCGPIDGRGRSRGGRHRRQDATGGPRPGRPRRRACRAPGFGAAVAAPLRAALSRPAAVLVSDYGRGVAADPSVRSALCEALRSGVPVVWDPHPRGPPRCRGSPWRRPTWPRPAASPDHRGGRETGRPGRAAGLVGRRGRGDVRGSWSGAGRTGGSARVPARRVSGGDPCGAGDAFAGSLAAALAAGRTPLDAVRYAVHRAAHFVGQGGAGAFAAHGTAAAPRHEHETVTPATTP